jgi:hypothetical protein
MPAVSPELAMAANPRMLYLCRKKSKNPTARLRDELWFAAFILIILMLTGKKIARLSHDTELTQHTTYTTLHQTTPYEKNH